MPTYRIETDQGTFDIDADREPTQEEALRAISGSNQPASMAAPPSEFDQFRQAFIQKEQAPTLNQVIEAFKAPVQGVAGMVSDVAGIPSGLGEASGAEEPLDVIARSQIEGARRSGLDVLNLGESIAKQIAQGAIQGRGVAPVNVLSGIIGQEVKNLMSRTPSEREIEGAFESQQALQNQLAPESRLVEGPISESLSQGIRALAPMVAPEISTAITGGKSVATSVASGGLRGVAAPIESAAQAVKARGVTKPPLIQDINRVTGLTTLDDSVQKASILKSTFEEAGIPKNIGAVEALESIPKAQDFVLKETMDGLKAADKRGMAFNGDGAFISGRQAVLDTFPSVAKSYAQNPAVLDDILKNLDFVKGNLTPLEGQAILKELNFRYKSLVDKNSPEAFAYRAVRNSMSDQLDSIWRNATGVDKSPYRNWGVLQDISDGLEGKIRAAENLDVTTSPTGMPLTAAELARKAVRKVARPLIPLETEALDKAIKRVLKDAPNPKSSTPPVIGP